MDTGKLADMVEVFEGLEDWRSAQQTRHRLCEVLTVAVCAVLSGADDFEEISQWGRAKLPWLRGFLRLDYGVASPDTAQTRKHYSGPLTIGDDLTRFVVGDTVKVQRWDKEKKGYQ